MLRRMKRWGILLTGHGRRCAAVRTFGRPRCNSSATLNLKLTPVAAVAPRAA
jgi:hypothetical protein